MGQYSNKGLYAGYDKNNKERDALDYYATPPWEVKNILSILDIQDMEHSLILDPCCGGGHLIEGVIKTFPNATIIGTDVQERENPFYKEHSSVRYYSGLEYDFLSEEYPYKEIDYIITNPPFKTIIPFTLHSLDIAKKGVIMLARLKFLESVARYEKIFKNQPPTEVYVYVDRIACYKNGDFSMNPNAIEAYAWFYWDKNNIGKTELKFIRKA